MGLCCFCIELSHLQMFVLLADFLSLLWLWEGHLQIEQYQENFDYFENNGLVVL